MKRAIVLVGGMGSGVKAISGGAPKALLKVAGKSVIERIIENLLVCGLREVVLVSDQPTLFEDVTVKYGDVIDVQVVKQVGSGIRDAILSARDMVSSASLLIYGDTLVPHEEYRMVINAYITYGRPVILVVPEEDVKLYGAVLIGEGNRVSDFIEKPSTDIDGAYAYGGVAVFDKELVETLEESSNVDEGIRKYVSRKALKAAIWSGWWVDIGFPWDILKANYYVLNELDGIKISSKASIASTAVVKGPLIIEDEVVVDHYTVLEGPLFIGRGSEISPYTLISKYSSLEELTYIDTYSEVFWSSIQPKVVVGSNSHIYLTVIGSEAVIEGNVVTAADLRKDLILRAVSSKSITLSKALLNIIKSSSSIGSKTRVRAGTIMRMNMSSH
ncbi:MAG: sugar phosphate nucleotidyltransferase [Sulfolobales archaeon]